MKDGVPSQNSEAGINCVFGSNVKSKSRLLVVGDVLKNVNKVILSETVDWQSNLLSCFEGNPLDEHVSDTLWSIFE